MKKQEYKSLTLEEMRKLHREKELKVHRNRGIEDGPEVLKGLLTGLFVEVGEFANEIEVFKYWKKNKNNDREKMIEEYTDIFSIWLSLGNQCGFTPQEIEEAFKKKMDIYVERSLNDY